MNDPRKAHLNLLNKLLDVIEAENASPKDAAIVCGDIMAALCFANHLSLKEVMISTAKSYNVMVTSSPGELLEEATPGTGGKLIN